MRGSSPRSSSFLRPVWALEAAPTRIRRATPAATQGALLGLASGLGVWAALAVFGWIGPRAFGLGAAVAGHGALLGASLGRAAAVSAPGWPLTGAVLITAGLLALGATGATRGPTGALAYLALPAWLLLLSRWGRLTAVGVRRPEPAAAILAGLGLGAALGGHLLLSATLSLGYRVRQDGLAGYVAAFAYDIGANVPSGELFFRGVLFDHLQRRWSFIAGAALATAAYLARYLLDPRLPGTTEAVVGGVVYLSLLSFGNCWLFWWSGSLIPALVSALAFFASYRMLVGS
jgi:Type II CAAX prenyl endopeptidase Rce1-like